MSTGVLLALTLLIAALLYWFNGMRAKEIASEAGRQRCRMLEVDFLDDSVVLTRLRLGRDRDGRLRFLREYQFEFSSDGRLRYGGEIGLCGDRVEYVVTDAYRIPDEH